MKKLFILLIVVLFLCSPIVVHAQEATDPVTYETMETTVSSEAAGQESQNVATEEYILPYPGLLPDSPIYVLKTARDRLIGFLITDPTKKAAFNILQADKRLQAGVLLAQKGETKYTLVVSTISKGENYFEEAILKTSEGKKQGMEVSELQAKLAKAVKKHQLIIANLEKNAPKEQKDAMKQLQKRVQNFEKQIEAMNPSES